MGRLRQSIKAIHLWLGLGLGGLLVLAGLTGSALVFYVEVDGWLHPAQAAQGSANAASYDQAIATLHRQFPDKHGPWRLEVTGQPGAIPARYYNPPETAARAFAPMLVWLSPDGARVLRRDYWGDTAMTWIYDLHYQLQLGKTGGQVFGYAGLALLLLLLSGLWAWWPRGSWTKALRFKRRAARSRRLHDWHKLSGLAGLPLLLMLTLTGIMLALPDESNAVLTPLFGKPEPMHGSMQMHGHRHGLERRGPVRITPSEAVALARQVLPQAQPAWIEVPGSHGGAYRLRLRQSVDPSHRFPHSFVWIDPQDGTIQGVSDAAKAGATSTITNWLHPLHDGSAGGMSLRLLVFISGLAPLALFVTGLKRWRHRRIARRRRGGNCPGPSPAL